jgi:two-component system, NtrC family, response regulator HydG
MPKVTSATVLIADDDPQFLRVMEHHLKSWSYRVQSVGDKGALLERLKTSPPAVLLLDVRLGEHDGVEMLRQIQADHPGVRAVMLTAYGSIDDAISAMRFGAVDYLTKPVDLNRLRNVVAAAVEAATASGSRAAPGSAPSRPILGESDATRQLRELIGRAAATDSTVLILGESGTGKELVARALHEQSPRRGGPFIAINVAALPRELVESTLFGHVKGAFTGADQMQHGCCEAADGGTLFLDEIGEMEIGLQAKLLRFLQERSFQRVGQSSPVSVDVRVVAATNRNPLEQVRQGQLREDLYYRLNVLPILVPSLRGRKDDIPLLARHFLARFADRCGRPGLALEPDAIEALCGHEWPGNVRELENFVERLAVLSPGPTIRADDVRFDSGLPAAATGPSALEPAADPELTEMERIEKAAIVRALAASGGNVRDAAETLGLGQATVYRKVKKYGLSTRR